MSDDRTKKSRCIVKKLDFEDCVVSNVRAKTRGQKKLRAKSCRQIDDTFLKSGASLKRKFEVKRTKFDEGNSDNIRPASPVLSQRCPIVKNTLKESPVLVKKTPISPVLASKKKSRVFRRKLVLESPSTEKSQVLPSSPIFKQKTQTNDDFKIKDKSSPILDRKRKHRNEKPEPEIAKCSRFEIQETPDKPEEADLEMMIEVGTQSGHTKASSDYNIEEIADSAASSKDKISETSEPKTPPKKEEQIEEFIMKELELESAKKKKRYKPNTLSGRLQKLIKMQISDRRIWEHEKKITKSCRNIEETLVVETSWKNATRSFIKCRRVDNRVGINLTSEVLIIVDLNFVPDVRIGSLIRISPPWQKIHLSDRNMDVLLSVKYIEAAEGNGALPECATSYETLPVSQYEKADSLFINSLFTF